MPDSNSFRTRVIAIASELFPDVEFHAPVDEPDVLLAGKMQFGLQNIRAKFQLEEQTEQHLRALIETRRRDRNIAELEEMLCAVKEEEKCESE